MATPTTQDVSPDATPARIAKLDAFGGPGWLDTVSKYHAAYAPGTGRTIPVDVRSMRSATLLTPSTLGAIPKGGGVQVVSAGALTSIIPDTIFPNPRANSCAVTIRAAIPTPVSGQLFFFAIAVDDTNFYSICEQYNAGARATQISLLQFATSGNYQQGSGWAADGNLHDFTLALDTVNANLLVDGNLIVQTPLTGPSGACRLSCRCTSHYLPITDVAIAF